MKKIIFISGLAALLLSCKEHLIPMPAGGTASTDTTYMAPVEAPQQRNVLIEEFTGVSCPQCPEGHQFISGFETTYPGRIIAAGYYPFNIGQADPIQGMTVQDFRTTKATDLGSSFLGGVFFLPCATIDRTPFTGGSYLSDRNQWAGKVADRMQAATPVNMYVTSTYNDATHEATINVKAAFTQAVAKKIMLSVSVIENNIIDAQDFPTYTDPVYNHTHVMRDILTQTYGSPILDAVAKDAGRVYERTFKYTINTAWKPENCKVIAFISNNENNDKEVAQTAETNLK